MPMASAVSLLRRWVSTVDHARARVLRERARRLAARTLGEDGHGDQHQSAGKRQHPEPGMDQEAEEQEHRHPRQVDDRDRAGAGEEGADLVEVAQRLVRVARIARHDREPHHRAVHGGAEALVEHRGRAHHDARADQVEDALERIGADQEHGERDQGRDAAARQHAVVDLQHVERAGQHQHVHHAGEQRDAPERALAVGKRRRNRRMRLGPLRQGRSGHRSTQKMRPCGPSI